MTGGGSGKGALASVRVVEVGTMVAAPICGQLLADLGADVIKIEPLGGEVMRVIPPVYKGVSAAFAQWNRNKRSIALDLKSPEGMAVLRGLLARADIFLQNMRVGAAEAMGLDHESLIVDNPGLISVQITGYGTDGPYRDQPGYDMMVQGLTGFMPIQGTPEKPRAIRSVQADKVAGYSAALAALAAVIHRRAGGGGQKIDATILDSYASFMLPDHIYTRSFRNAPPEAPFTADIYNMIHLSDGKLIGYLLTQDQFEEACRAFGREDLMNDPRYSTPGGRNVHQPELIREIATACEGKTMAEVLAITRAHRLPFAPVNDIDGFFDDPQVRHNGSFVEFETEEVGPVRLLNGLARLSETPIDARSLAPSLGAHTDAILAELGYPEARIATMREGRIVG
ncbi:CaiB/BaiF CoA transferase family protein [Rhizorhabdus dicambivorans]|uniref:CoA transferase n=1 Tax=Rhizorhabdus dicambivorans TaxID=1850238 RepID=A0A2A4FVH6_9SPHN|nr:CoA transferase [Rhizorhabdus dicambivorans]ATE63658.1 CoA transferase [Rhizorhabdus dicambivorans]PCE42786.1 CoA transferase [Rhizorhabdus dicambivorans]